MLPAWATVAVAAVSAAAGVTGGVVTTWLRIRADRTEGELRRREPRIVAADDFATGVLQAVNATREFARIIEYAPGLVVRRARWRGRVATAHAEAERTIEVAHHRFPRVALLFRPTSNTTAEAERAIRALRHALAELNEDPPSVDEARVALDSAEEHRLAFSQRALDAISAP
jgi:hypothetical protein